MIAKAKRRVITIKFTSSKEAAEFLEQALSLVGNMAAVHSRDSLKLILLAPPSEAENDYRRLLTLLRQWKLSRRAPRRGVYKHSVSLLLSSANLKIGVPVAAVADTLALMGFVARVEGGYLVTNATLEQAVRAAELLSRKYVETLEVPASPLVRRLAAVLAASKGTTVDEAVKELQRRDIIKLDEGSGKLVLTLDYKEAIKSFLRSTS